MSHHHHDSSGRTNAFAELWNSFWYPPQASCPKCGGHAIEYYDPFFFSPIRTIKGKRRLKCLSCRFVWRPSRRGNSNWQVFNPLKPFM